VTKINVDLEGMSVLLSKLQQLGLAGDDVIEEVVFDLATETQALAVAGIDGPPKSGAVYQKANPTRTHTASAPGQYPASDRGLLASSVVAVPQGPMTYVVGTNVEYGPMLEFGTSRMAARPWLLPSFERARVGIEKELRIRLEAKT
jgi:phage gpG-like protein